MVLYLLTMMFSTAVGAITICVAIVRTQINTPCTCSDSCSVRNICLIITFLPVRRVMSAALAIAVLLRIRAGLSGFMA